MFPLRDDRRDYPGFHLAARMGTVISQVRRMRPTFFGRLTPALKGLESVHINVEATGATTQLIECKPDHNSCVSGLFVVAGFGWRRILNFSAFFRSSIRRLPISYCLWDFLSLYRTAGALRSMFLARFAVIRSVFLVYLVVPSGRCAVRDFWRVSRRWAPFLSFVSSYRAAVPLSAIFLSCT